LTVSAGSSPIKKLEFTIEAEEGPRGVLHRAGGFLHP